MGRKLKIILTICIATVLIWLSVMPFGALEIKRCYGDIDNDGYVTTVDARIALLVTAGIYNKTLVGLDFAAADMNDDGEISTVDARMILKTAAGQLAEKYMEGYEFSENHSAFIKIINDHRFYKNHKSVKLTMSKELNEVAKLAAQEYALKTNTAFVREDGTYFNKILNEKGITYKFADKIVITSGFGYEQAAEAMLADLQAEKALTSKNFSKIGVGAYSTDGRTFYWCVFVIK